MRYGEGDHVELFNGDGNNYSASIISVGKSAQVQIEAAELNTTESPVSVTLVQSLAKGTKLDLVIQKATELGVHRITPVSAERSVLQVDEKRAHKKADHWIKIARSACAQCNRSGIFSTMWTTCFANRNCRPRSSYYRSITYWRSVLNTFNWQEHLPFPAANPE